MILNIVTPWTSTVAMLLIGFGKVRSFETSRTKRKVNAFHYVVQECAGCKNEEEGASLCLNLRIVLLPYTHASAKLVIIC